MKYKLCLSTIVLALLVTACNVPVNEQIPTSTAIPIENTQLASTTAETDQAVSVEDSQAAGGDTSGYVLFAPLRSTTTYLINFGGNVVHTWSSQYFPGNVVYLLENGNLLRTGSLNNSTFNAGGAGGIVQEIDWDGNVVWEFTYSSDQYLLHHDIEQLPNGNILMIAWECKSTAEALAAGRNPNLLQEGALWPDKIIEVDSSTNQIVWEWHVWDHLVQDYDPSKANYGNPSEHPERIDLNYTTMNVADWNHTNSVDYNPELDQILLSVHSFSEIWVIDHSTTSAEAAGPGGDLLYRWGNPQAYGVGSASDQQLFGQHDAHWIEPGLPGEGNILIFNNGDRRSRAYSSIEEIKPPINADGSYALTPGMAFGPAASTWTYQAAPVTNFYATNISGAQRLPNGNTLICDGPSGRFFEVTPAGETAWEYVNSFGQSAPGNGGNGSGTGKMVFRAVYYAADYAGFAGRELNVEISVTAEQTGNDQGQGSQLPQGGQAQGLDGQRQPPQAATDACSTLSQGDACSFTGLRGTISGSCITMQSQLVCMPQGAPPASQQP